MVCNGLSKPRVKRRVVGVQPHHGEGRFQKIEPALARQASSTPGLARVYTASNLLSSPVRRTDARPFWIGTPWRVRRHYSGETFDPEDIYTGGGGDTGIDAVAVLVNGSLVTDVESLQEHAEISGHLDVTFIFVQADQGSSFDGKKVSDFGFGVKDFFESDPKLTRNQAIKDACEITEELYEGGTKFRPEIPHAAFTTSRPEHGRTMPTSRRAVRPSKRT